MSEVHNWSTAAGNNNASPPDGWPENVMTFGQVNNTAREMMAAVARWYVDTSGILLATGLHYHAPANAWGYQLTQHRQFSNLNLDMRVRFRTPVANVGPTWLTLNGVGPAWIKWPDGSDCRANDLPDVVDLSWHGSQVWVLNNLPKRRMGEFDPQTAMLFYATVAPRFWTQLTGWNDRFVRVVSGQGTGTGGSHFISGLSFETQNHTHVYSFSVGTTAYSSPAAGGFEFGAQASAAAPSTHSHTVAHSGATAGISNSHTHNGDGSWRPAFGDMILCARGND